MTMFLPTLSSMIVDNHLRPVLARLPNEPLPVLRAPTQLFMIFIKESEVAAMIALYHTIQVGDRKLRVVSFLVSQGNSY